MSIGAELESIFCKYTYQKILKINWWVWTPNSISGYASPIPLTRIALCCPVANRENLLGIVLNSTACSYFHFADHMQVLYFGAESHAKSAF